MLSEIKLNVERNRRISVSMGIVLLMFISSLSMGLSARSWEAEPEYIELSEDQILSMSDVQVGSQANYGPIDSYKGTPIGPDGHPALWDTQYSDPGILTGKLLEESRTSDHDNDGIDDLNDLDDDNDGIYDLLELFDGCYGTHPYDHDNDGIHDHIDNDDDNDGILEGPIDYDALEALGYDPRNVSMERFVTATTVHPWTGTEVGAFYRADQLPFDHDNDGVPDEDSDGSGAGRYDEDDDNDGRIDQYKWPCDFDNDGIQDYFDLDDDGDTVNDVMDSHPYDKTITTDQTIVAPFEWTFGQYRDYSGGVDFVALERLRTDADNTHTDTPGGGTPSFSTIIDGDFDGDGIPNFLDPDDDNDETPDSADTDDDNDGLLDMWDPDDDNDGIPDVCINIDTNGDEINDYTGTNTTPYQTPGADTDGVAGTDCEIDYDSDLDDDRWRPFDQNYNGKWDWLDSDLGGTTTPDNPENDLNAPYDLDDDGKHNENDTYPLDSPAVVASWNCPTLGVGEASPDTSSSVKNPSYIPTQPSGDGDPNNGNECLNRRASWSAFNDWDNDGINNWDDIDDDGDGIIDFLDIDEDCDLDNDNDLHLINGAKYRDDGPNHLDSDIDGDGLENDIDWDDDNDGISDLYDPDDGNCGIIDYDQTDSFSTPWYPIGDGDRSNGAEDNQDYTDNYDNYWAIVFLINPFADDVILNYNGYDSTLPADQMSGQIPEFYWFMLARWSSWNGGNEWDIDSDGDSMINGLDVDQDADGLPDWWDQDEGNDGVLDVHDFKMGGTIDLDVCGITVGQFGEGRTCGYTYAFGYQMPLTGTGAQFGSPYSVRPDADVNQGGFNNPNNANWGCTPGATGGCWHYDFGADGNTDAAISFQQMTNNRDAFMTWIGLQTQIWSWNTDNTNPGVPDELGADLLKNDVDGDIDGDFWNNTIDLDDDYDGVYDWYDVDDDNDGVWDFFEVDSNDDLDDDNGQDNGNFFGGTNCDDNDDDGNDNDVDDDGWYQPVWDRGAMTQGLKSPRYYDVDNDNDGVPDPEDPDDDNNGVDDITQESTAGCFWGEEQSPFDHDNDGIVDWVDDDWDGDGLTNTVEIAVSITAPFDHDNDGERDDLDDDDDEDGMKDEDEVLLWPLRFDSQSTNPWDHDDFGTGEGLADPNDLSTGPDVIDKDDDGDTHNDTDFDHLEEGSNSYPCYQGALSSDWDSDNNCKLDKDDKQPTYITLDVPDTLWIETQSPAIFTGHVDWIDPTTNTLAPAVGFPVQVHIEWAGNNTTAIETIDVLTNTMGNFTIGQFLYPEDIIVGDNDINTPAPTYRVYAEVTEMFAFNGNQSASYYVGVEANLTVDYAAWTYFRSDEQPLWLDFKAHYSADWDRGFYDNRIIHVPITFEISGAMGSELGEMFGNHSLPTKFAGFNQEGYRTDANGWASIAFEQSLGASGSWIQVRWNSTMPNPDSSIPGGYEIIEWDDNLKRHNIAIEGRYDYTNTSLPYGDLQITGHVEPQLTDKSHCHDSNMTLFPMYTNETDCTNANNSAGESANLTWIKVHEWPFQWLGADSTDTFNVKVMHRMNINGEMIVSGINPVYYWNSSIDNGDGSFGAWATLFHKQALMEAGITYDEAKAYKPYPLLWNGSHANLNDETAALRDFISVNSTHWFIELTNGGSSDLPPCGKVDRLDPNSEVRCEIIPEMHTGSSFKVRGDVENRTGAAWANDPVSLQVDIDNNGQYTGTLETAFTQEPNMIGGKAVYDYNWTWYSTYTAGTYSTRIDFSNSQYFFTGNSTTLALTGAYINVSLIGTTDFVLTTAPKLYRNDSSLVGAKLIDNAGIPVRGVAVNWSWSADGNSGENLTDDNGLFNIPFDIPADHDLGEFRLQFSYAGDSLRTGSTAAMDVWIVSRTHINVVSTDDNVRQSGDMWDFTAQVTDDNKTAVKDSGGKSLSGYNSPDGGLVDVIFEGQSFSGGQHRQVIATLAPNAGLISLPNPQPDGSHLCFYDGNGDGFADRDTNTDGNLDRNESINCLKSNIAPLNPQLLREDPESFLPDGFGPVTVYLRFEENLPNEGCMILEPSWLDRPAAWDECITIPGNDEFRVKMPYNANGFALIGRTDLTVDDQIVYTSDFNEDTNEFEIKPMIVTGNLTDELGTPMTDRNIRVSYEMVNSQDGPVACPVGETDGDGRYAISCHLDNVVAGKAKVTVTYSSYDNNDAYRFQNRTVQEEFEVFSNSSISIDEVGPFKNSFEQREVANGTIYDVLYLKESFHIHAKLQQSNGQAAGGKCLNIYLDPQDNVRPITSIKTNEVDGKIEWFSGDPVQNPSLSGVDTKGGKLEGLRLLRIAYEPDYHVSGGCDKDPSSALNGSHVDKWVLVRSRVDIQIDETWSYLDEDGIPTDTPVFGSVALQRNRLDFPIENEEVWFVREYWDNELNEWVIEGRNESITNEQGVASFTWKFGGLSCDGAPCEGTWRIRAYYPETIFFEGSEEIINEVHYAEADVTAASEGFFTPSTIFATMIIALAAAIAGIMYYQRTMARRQVEALRGILTDTMMQLKAANEYIAIIFDCYKKLVQHFRKHGFMKKVYETTREFEAAVRKAFDMVPQNQLDAFLSIFEEARYSDHDIGPSHRDSALATLDVVANSLTFALGEDGLVKREASLEAGLYDKNVKAGSFVTADGTIKIQGEQEDLEQSNFKI